MPLSLSKGQKHPFSQSSGLCIREFFTCQAFLGTIFGLCPGSLVSQKKGAALQERSAPDKIMRPVRLDLSHCGYGIYPVRGGLFSKGRKTLSHYMGTAACACNKLRESPRRESRLEPVLVPACSEAVIQLRGAFHFPWNILLRPLEKRPPRTKGNRTGRYLSGS